MDIALKGQKHSTECKATAPSTPPKVGAFSEAWKSKECSVLQCVMGIECCLLPVRGLVRAGTGLNATFATGASFLSSSQLRMYEHYPCTHSWAGILVQCNSMADSFRQEQSLLLPLSSLEKNFRTHFRNGFLEQTACACKAS